MKTVVYEADCFMGNWNFISNQLHFKLLILETIFVQVIMHIFFSSA